MARPGRSHARTRVPAPPHSPPVQAASTLSRAPGAAQWVLVGCPFALSQYVRAFVPRPCEGSSLCSEFRGSVSPSPSFPLVIISCEAGSWVGRGSRWRNKPSSRPGASADRVSLGGRAAWAWVWALVHGSQLPGASGASLGPRAPDLLPESSSISARSHPWHVVHAHRLPDRKRPLLASWVSGPSSHPRSPPSSRAVFLKQKSDPTVFFLLQTCQCFRIPSWR